MIVTIDLIVNGQPSTVEVDPRVTLLGVLRDHLGLTGTKYGCGEGQCGACTVVIDGSPTRSCMIPARAAAGRKVTTIESLARGDRLHPLQEAFLEADALQCGYCTSGMIISALSLLEKNPHPDEAEIVDFMNGNICRSVE